MQTTRYSTFKISVLYVVTTITYLCFIHRQSPFDTDYYTIHVSPFVCSPGSHVCTVRLYLQVFFPLTITCYLLHAFCLYFFIVTCTCKIAMFSYWIVHTKLNQDKRQIRQYVWHVLVDKKKSFRHVTKAHISRSYKMKEPKRALHYRQCF